jgi:hypothetical protein
MRSRGRKRAVRSSGEHPRHPQELRTTASIARTLRRPPSAAAAAAAAAPAPRVGTPDGTTVSVGAASGARLAPSTALLRRAGCRTLVAWCLDAARRLAHRRIGHVGGGGGAVGTMAVTLVRVEATLLYLVVAARAHSTDAACEQSHARACSRRTARGHTTTRTTVPRHEHSGDNACTRRTRIRARVIEGLRCIGRAPLLDELLDERNGLQVGEDEGLHSLAHSTCTAQRSAALVSEKRARDAAGWRVTQCSARQ